MMINALNSGASGFMADFEDANSPTWTNVVEGQANLVDAVEGTLAFDAPDGRRIPPVRRPGHAARPTPRVAPARTARGDRWGAGLREPLRLRPLRLPLRRAAARARERAVPLPAEAREPPRGAALGERVPARRGHARARPRDDQGDRPDRDDPRRLRDGRDPLGAARPLAGAERRALGLHLQRHQEVPGARRRAAPRPRAGDDDRAVHARLRDAAREDVPSRAARTRSAGWRRSSRAGATRS